MAVAFDAYTRGLGTNGLSIAHTPAGTPRAVIALAGGDSGITGFTYGGVALTQVTGSPNSLTTGETGHVQAWFLGSGIPTGAQNLVMTSNGSTYVVNCITLTAAADTAVIDADSTINTTSVVDPTVTLSLAARTAFAAIVFVSGQDAAAGITPFANWTARDETDGGTFMVGCYTYDTIGSTDVSAGWTQTAEDAVAIAIAVSEVIPSGGIYYYRIVAGMGA